MEHESRKIRNVQVGHFLDIHVDVQVYNQPPVQIDDRREVALKSPRMKKGGLIRAADSMISKGVQQEQ